MADSVAPVLYAEDEVDDVYFMHAAFKRAGLEGRLQTVSDGEQAIRYLAGSEPYADRGRYPLPAVLLLDLNLPVRSGFEVLAWVRRQGHLSHLPVVVFSSSGRAEDRGRATTLGATRYILKPSSGGEFVEVANLLRDWCAGES